MNFKTSPGVGHAKGMFFELNLYSKKSQTRSADHTSTVSGRTFPWDDSHDGVTEDTKGSHWRA